MEYFWWASLYSKASFFSLLYFMITFMEKIMIKRLISERIKPHEKNTRLNHKEKIINRHEVIQVSRWYGKLFRFLRLTGEYLKTLFERTCKKLTHLKTFSPTLKKEKRRARW